ncbi:MAG: HAMP domain-containing histidine kinase [Bacillus sp. (in: Bacteria)]|nr:HAMP domain-containing histidine kinase [Bacillus sp. (in: firmicutes)]
MILLKSHNISKQYGELDISLKNEFSSLKRKLLLQVISIAIITGIIGMIINYAFIDGILQAPFADLFIHFCVNVLQLDYQVAQATYFTLFQRNKTLLLAFGFIVLMLFIFYFALTRITRYFNDISVAVDKLVEESKSDIFLPPELNFMEKKLNKVKNTLERRAKDAQDAEQRKNDLVVYLAHDIKTPLTSVIGYLSLLEEASDMPEKQKDKYVKITLEKAYRLEQLINEFFDITRFNLQKIQLDKETINLSYMLLQMADEFYPLLEPNGKKAVVHAEEHLTVHGDADKLARLFNNILKNAIAYSYENSTIEITAKKQTENIVITFSNQGKTIPPEKLHTIFEKFYRLDTSRSSQTGGAGLGLAIAKEIATAHNGSISVESNDSQTAFTVVLPIQS